MASNERGFSLVELMMTLGVIGIVCALAIPITDTSLRVDRLRGDATALRNLVGLAKIRASSRSTRARVHVDLGANTYALEIWDRTGGAWVNESGTRPLSAGVTFGFGALATAPPNTQATIGMSPECTAGLTATDSIANTACITFNSRGLPVDADGNLYPRHALYRAWHHGGIRHHGHFDPADSIVVVTERQRRMDVQVRESLTEKGFSLIETMVALALVVVVAAGVLPLGVIALSTSENQGHLRRGPRNTPRTKSNSCWRFRMGIRRRTRGSSPLGTWEAAA